MYTRFYIDSEIMVAVKSALDEYHAVRITRLESLKDADEDTFAFESRECADLSRLCDRFDSAVKYGETEQDENEQLEAIDALLKKISKEARYSYGSRNRAEQLVRYFESIREDKERAYSIFAEMVDDFRIKILAVKFLVKSVLNSATHREKDTKLYMTLESLDALVEQLARTDKDHPEQYHWRFSGGDDTGSWDYKRALRDLHYRNSQVERLEKENAELLEKLAAFEPKQEPEQNSSDKDGIDF